MSLLKRSLVAGIIRGDNAAEDGKITSADRIFTSSEVNPSLVDRLGIDGVERAVGVLPVQSVKH